MMSGDLKFVLLPNEIETYVQAIEPSEIEKLGTKGWFLHHQRLQKLHQQAVWEAQGIREETVKEMIISYLKISVLVYEAVCVSVWKEKVFPELLHIEPEPKNTFLPYMILHHEATAIGFLETILYHSDSCEALGDSSLELLDYCMFAMTCLVGKSVNSEETPTEETPTGAQELKRQKEELAFEIGIRCICILGYIARYMDNLSLSATSRMYSTHDTPMLLVALLENPPWVKRDKKGQILKYIDGKWQPVIGENNIRITQTEGQVWLALRQLLLDQRCPVHYDINDYRRNQLLKLQRYLHDSLLDQLCPLIDLKRWLAQLAAVSVPPTSKRPLIMEVIPQMRQTLLNKKKKYWKQLALHHVKLLFNCEEQQMMDVAKSLSETYDIDVLEALCPNPRVCEACGDQAIKRCSRCKSSWYCGRECQVKSWSKHKTSCDLVTASQDIAATQD